MVLDQPRPGASCLRSLLPTSLVVAEALPEVKAIYLFGFFGTDTATRSSDIDLAILALAPVAVERLASLRELLAERARRDVDLAGASTVMRAQVVSTGRLLLDADPSFREQFETTVCSSYARLNEERREILERIQREGRVHGR